MVVRTGACARYMGTFRYRIAYTWWEEPGEALNGRLMDPYEAVKMLRKTGAIELQQAGVEEARDQSERLV
jgi:hypothetical protein